MGLPAIDPAVLFNLHLVFENLKVDRITQPQAYTLGSQLLVLAYSLGWTNWVQAYQNQGVLPAVELEEEIQHAPAPAVPPLPDLLTWLYQCLEAADRTDAMATAVLESYPTPSTVPTPFRLSAERLHCLVHSFDATLPSSVIWEGQRLATLFRALTDSSVTSDELVRLCLQAGWTRNRILRFVPAVQLPILEALRLAQRNPPGDLCPATLALIDRPDLVAMIDPPSPPPHRQRSLSLDEAPDTLALYEEHTEVYQPSTTTANLTTSAAGSYPSSYAWLTEPASGKALNLPHHEIMALRFPVDQRMREVCRLLRSDRPVRLSATPPPDPNDPAGAEQTSLQLLATRTLALPVGRGMLQFASTLPVLTEKFPVPGLRVAARFGDSKLALDLATPPIEAENLLSWPSFHDGVAAALSISPTAAALGTSWVLLNQSEALDEVKIAASSSTGHTRLTPEAIVSLSSHAGWIFGLGLTRHLRTLVSWSAFQYLATKHVPTAVGLLLGMAAAHLGTADPDVTRLLAVHVPAFLPPNAAELQLSPLTHIAGLMGLGLLHVRTCHRRTAEVLAQEFRGSGDAVAPDAAYVWTIGCGLGLVTLGAGSTAAGLADLHLAELLAQYLEPGSADPRVHPNPTYTRAVQADGHTRWSTSVPFSAPSLAGLVIDATEDREGRPPSLMRTPSTLTQAAAATLALSLMYLHTEDRAVADQLALPATTYLLSRLHPTLALQRTLGQSIILWSLTTPTLAWLLAACPHAGVRAPASLLEAEGHLYPLSDDPADLPRCPDLLTGLGDPIRRVYASAVTGAALALGLKYAGTSAPAATRTLLWWYDHLFLWSKRPAVGYESGLTRQTLRRCFHTTAAAAAMVQAGTGHLPLFRRLRALHGRLHTDISYGDHLLCHMAMGLVFLGAGNYTLSATDPMATAALLISFYPVVNPTPDANTNYLQVFRHLWVLAVERRCVVVRDVADGTILPLTLRVTLRPTRDPAAASASSTRDSTIATPGSLPDWSTIQTVRLDNVGFWPVEIDSDRHPRLISALRATCTIWVKARPASMLKSIIPAIPSLDRSSTAHPCDLYPLITALYPGVASTGPSGLPMQALRSVVDRLGEWRHFTAWIATGESHYNDPMPGMPTVSLDDAFMADIICAGLAVEEPAVVPVYMHLLQQWRVRHGSSVTTPATSDGVGRLYRSLERTECRLVVDFYLRLRPSLPQLAAEVPLISPHFLHLLRHDL